MDSAWRFVIPAPHMGEKLVPAPKTGSILGLGDNVIIKKTGTWIHEQDWPYLQSLQFPCRGVMKNGLAVGCPDANQIKTRPPEPPYDPPPAFFRVEEPPPAVFEAPAKEKLPAVEFTTRPKRRKRKGD